jgi:hypothetical protein
MPKYYLLNKSRRSIRGSGSGSSVPIVPLVYPDEEIIDSDTIPIANVEITREIPAGDIPFVYPIASAQIRNPMLNSIVRHTYNREGVALLTQQLGVLRDEFNRLYRKDLDTGLSREEMDEFNRIIDLQRKVRERIQRINNRL